MIELLFSSSGPNKFMLNHLSVRGLLWSSRVTDQLANGRGVWGVLCLPGLTWTQPSLSLIPLLSSNLLRIVTASSRPAASLTRKVRRAESLSVFCRDGTKPHFPEFLKIGTATFIGFALMGFIGFFVKLMHIPINNVILGV